MSESGDQEQEGRDKQLALKEGWKVLAAPLGARQPAWPCDYYNLHLYRFLYSSTQLYTYQLLDPEGSLQAFIHLLPEEEQLISLPGLPFGGFLFEEELAPVALDFFIETVQQEVLKLGYQQLWLNQAPDCYHASNKHLHDLLLSQGFQLRYQAINHHIPLSSESLFEEGLHDSERRRLQKCHNAGFELSKEPVEHVGLLFRFIQNCRKAQGRTLSLSEGSFLSQFHAAPERYPLFAVWHDEELIAACISVQVLEQTLYAFYPAYEERYHTYSPTVMLYEGIYRYCQQQHIYQLDLGTSMLEGGPNQNLIRFKERVGGRYSPKRSYQWAPQ